jgi:hypothetical protein
VVAWTGHHHAGEFPCGLDVSALDAALSHQAWRSKVPRECGGVFDVVGQVGIEQVVSAPAERAL